MTNKKTCRKMWGILFIVILLIGYLCTPVRYTDAAGEKEATSVTASKSSAQAAKAKLSKTKATVIMGNMLTLTVENLDNSKVSTIKWKANRTSIAKVNQGGVVTPVKAGTTTIKCIITYKDKTEQTLSCTVTVKNRIKATNVTITNKAASLQVGDTLILKAGLSPVETTDQVYWFSSNKTVATVGLTSGKVTAKKAGTVVITVKAGQDKKDANVKTNEVVTEIKIKVTSKDESKNAMDGSLFTWSENESGLTITGYENDLPEDVVIPEKINGKSVTQIGYAAFANCSNLNSITIPKSVKEIEGVAFQYCRSLKEITIPEGVTSINRNVFEGCSSLSRVIIPESVTEIGYDAFNGCSSLEKIIIPEGITYIGSSAFMGCSSLNSIAIPKSVTEIETWAFRNCDSLKEFTIPEGITNIANSMFEGCSNLNSVTIPESVKSIRFYAFKNCSSLEKIIIPDGVIEIYDYAFAGCSSLKSITIPEGVTEINDYVFYNCRGLKEILIPEGVTKIERYAFYNCSNLNSVIIPKSVAKIDDSAFGGIENLEIHGEKGSYAQEYAQEHGIIFIEE